MEQLADEVIAHLRRRYGYDEWRNTTRLPENLFIWRFQLRGGEIPGWRPERVDRVEMPDTAVEIRSAWVPVQGPGDLLLLDILESTSREAAHAALLRMLSDFQSPLVTRIESETAGDVMFAFPGDTVRIFARGNLVVVVRSAARPVRPVAVPASQLDAELVRKPMSAASFRRQILRPASAAPLAPGATVRLDMNIDPSETRAMTYKFFAASGEVSLQDGGPVYRATKEGPQELTVVALDDRGETVRQDLALE